MSEFAFELELCAALEADGSRIVARQLGGGVAVPGGRVLDTVLLEPGPGFEDRVSITDESIPGEAIEAPFGPGRFRAVTDAIDAPPKRARAIAERAADVGFLELDRRRGSLCARQVTRYPVDWFDELVAIENKPDLGSPGALQDQLRLDVSLALVDRVVLATASHVTGAHLNRIPDAVGVWRFHREDGRIEELRPAQQLSSDDYGIELLDRLPGRADIEVVDPDAKARARRRVAERAYGKGWRTFDLPSCAEASVATSHGTASLPYCAFHDRVVDPATDCGSDCAGFEQSEPPPLDADTERAERTPWVDSPTGHQRRQAGLDRFQ